MEYIIETIVIPEYPERFTHFSPKGALQYVKENNGKVFLRNKEAKVEEMIVYIGGNLVEIRIKHNHKIVDDVESLPFEVQDVLDAFNEAMGIWF